MPSIFDFFAVADDTNVFISGYDIGELYFTMNRELINVTNWCKANVLSLNVKKSVLCYFINQEKKTIPW